MSEPKSFASLSPTLLARKGTAKPAMRPQSFRLASESQTSADLQADDLGWNDMGDDSPPPQISAPVEPTVLRPVAKLHNIAVTAPVETPAIVEQHKALAQQFAPVAKLAPPAPPALRLALGSQRKAAFTLRLDPERHLRLRLISAVNHRSAQQIVTLALDEYFARQPENNCLTR